MPGTLTISTLSDGTNSTSATNPIRGSAKAFAFFNGATASIIGSASYNVSSITRSSAGVYVVNLTAGAVSSGNYAVVASGSNASSGGYFTYILDGLSVRTSSSFNLVTCNAAATALDSLYTSIAVYQ